MGIPIHVPIRHPRSWATSTPAASTLRTQHVPKSPDERPRTHPCSTGQDKIRGHERPSTCGSVAWGQRSHPSRSMYDDSLCCLGRSGDDSPSTIMSSGHMAPSLKVRFPQSRKGARDGRYGSPLASYRPSLSLVCSLTQALLLTCMIHSTATTAAFGFRFGETCPGSAVPSRSSCSCCSSCASV